MTFFCSKYRKCVAKSSEHLCSASLWSIGDSLLTFLRAGLQGTLTAIRDWFRDYKIPDGKPANRFGLDNKPADKVKDHNIQGTNVECFNERCWMYWLQYLLLFFFLLMLHFRYLPLSSSCGRIMHWRSLKRPTMHGQTSWRGAFQLENFPSFSSSSNSSVGGVVQSGNQITSQHD